MFQVRELKKLMLVVAMLVPAMSFAGGIKIPKPHIPSIPNPFDDIPGWPGGDPFPKPSLNVTLDFDSSKIAKDYIEITATLKAKAKLAGKTLASAKTTETYKIKRSGASKSQSVKFGPFTCKIVSEIVVDRDTEIRVRSRTECEGKGARYKGPFVGYRVR